MENWIHRIWKKWGATTDEWPAGTDAAIELILDHSCPKIRRVRGYQKQLRGSVAAALGHIRQMIEAIPGPLDVTSEAALQDGLIRPFFLNADRVAGALNDDHDLKEYLAHPGDDLFYVLLTMNREVKTVYGSRVQGDIVYRDVALKSVDFSDHQFRVPAPTLPALVRSLEDGVLQLLAHWALEKIIEEKSRMEELSRLEQEVSVKVKILAGERQQMVLEWRDEPDRPSYRAAQKLLDDIEKELKVIKAHSSDMTYYLGEVNHILQNATQSLSARKSAMHFGDMGLLIDGRPADETAVFETLNVSMGAAMRRSCVLLRCSRKVMDTLAT